MSGSVFSSNADTSLSDYFLFKVVLLLLLLKEHPTKKRLYGHLPPISVSLRERMLRLAGHSELVSDTLLWNLLHGKRSVGRPHHTYIDQLVDDPGCHLEDLPMAMSDRDGLKERVRGIREEFST